MAEQTDVKLIIQARDEASKHLRELVDATQKFVDENKKLTQSGDKADSTLRSLRSNYQKLADAADKLASSKGLADAFEKQSASARKAYNDLQASVQSLNKVNQAQKEAAASTDKHNTALEKSRTKVRSQTSMVSRYRKQLTELQQAEGDNSRAIAETNTKLEAAQQKLTEARRERDQLTRTTKESRAEERKLSTEYNRLEKAIDKQRASFKQANAAKREAGAAAREAGVDTSRLAAEQDRLQKELEQTESELNQARTRTREYSQALKQNAADSKKAGRNTNLFGEESRKSMSVVQRMRGQVLSLAAAYIGVYGAINQVTQAFDTYFKQQSAAARLATQFGEDQAALGQELDYVSYLADRLGRDLETLETSYSQFFVVSKELGNTTDETRGLFSLLAEASTAMKLTADDFNGAMRAITQIMSKGQVMAEELRGQLGERLPGAVSLMSKALGKSEQDLNKMMEQGELTAESLFAFSMQVRESFGKGLPQAMNTFQAAWNRLQNAVTRNRRMFAGAAEGQLRESIERLTQFLNSDQAAVGVKALADGFASLINALTTMLDHLDEIKAVMEFIFLTWGLKAVMDMGAAVITLGLDFRRATGRVNKFGKALRAALIIPALFSGGKYVWENWGDSLGIVFTEQLPAQLKLGMDLIELYIERVFRKLQSASAQFTGQTMKLVAAVFEDFGFTEISDNIKADAVAGAADAEAVVADIEARIAEKRVKHLKGQEQILKSLKNLRSEGDPASSGSTGLGDELYDKGIEAAEERARQAQREAEARQIAAEAAKTQAKADKEAAKLKKDLYNLETKLLKDRAKSIREQKDLVDRELMSITDRLTMAGDLSGLEIVEQYRQMKYEAIETAAAKEREKRAQDDLNDLMQQRRDIVEYINTLQNSSRPGDQAQLESMREALSGINEQLTKAIDQMIMLAEAADNPALVAKLEQMKANLGDVNNDLIVTGEQINQQIAQRGSQAFMEIGESMGKFLSGAGSLSDVFKDAGNAFRAFAADTLKWLAQLILRTMILKAIQSAGFGGFVAGGVNAGVAHSGGIAGSGGNGRKVSPGWFAGAAKYHTGGVAGLRPNEVPTILEKGEEVLTRNDPRHRFNAGGAGTGQTGQPFQIINAIDSDEVVQKGLSSGKGKRTVINMIRSNRSEIKQILG